MSEKVMENNKVSVIGTVVSEFTFSHEVFGEGFYLVDLSVSRLSEQADIIPLMISERLIDVTKNYEGCTVEAIGQFRSYNAAQENGSTKLMLTVFARDVIFYDAERETDLNTVELNGFICKPPIYRTTPFNREITDFLLAVNRSYNKSDYIPCIAWGRNARFCGKLSVGENVKVVGRMQSRVYQKKQPDGSVLDKTAYEVSVSQIELNKPDLQKTTE